MKALQAERTEGSNERVQLTKKITAEETSVEQLRGKLHTVLQKAKVEEVRVCGNNQSNQVFLTTLSRIVYYYEKRVLSWYCAR